MTQNIFLRRRALLQALAGVLFVSRSSLSFGQSDKAAPGKADAKAGKITDEEKANKGAAKKSKPAVLTVVVMGKDETITQAEVKVTFPASVGGDATLPTNQAGEATFNSAGTGTAKVRVIVSGWESALQTVVLKEGPQRLTIKLNRLPEPK